MYFSSTSGTPSFFVTIHCLVRIVAFFQKGFPENSRLPGVCLNHQFKNFFNSSMNVLTSLKSRYTDANRT